MPRIVTSIAVFLASPMDVVPEREVVERVIREWNLRHGRDRNVHFDLLRYETSVSAGFGHDGQDVINSQIDDNYDLLIALFWKRLGSETPRARSGTVEEYERALGRYKSAGNVDLAFFFKDSPIDFRRDDLSQASRVQELEKEVQAAGALSKMFRDDEALTFEVNILLDRKAREFSSGFGDERKRIISRQDRSSSDEVDSRDMPNTPTGDANGDDADPEAEELGYFDYSENFTIYTQAAVGFLTKMGDRLDSLGQVMNKTTEEITQITSVRSMDASEGRLFVNKVSDEMDEFSAFLEEKMPDYANNSSLMWENVRGLINISYDFLTDDGNGDVIDNLVPFRDTIIVMRNSMVSAFDSILGYITSIKSLQRMTSSFNKSKKRLIQNTENLRSKMEGDLALTAQAIDELEALINTAGSHRPKSKPC